MGSPLTLSRCRCGAGPTAGSGPGCTTGERPFHHDGRHLLTPSRRRHVDEHPPQPADRDPRRAARWSATHPWRAILAWLAFVLVAVGLAIAVIPTERDHGRRLPARRVRPRRRDGAPGRARRRPRRERPDHRARDGCARHSAPPTQAARAPPGPDARRSTGSTRSPQPQWNADRSALLISVQLTRDRTTPRRCRTSPRASQARPPRPAGPRGRRRLDRRRPSTTASREDLSLRRGHQPPGHPAADAAGLRRPDRRRHPGPARRHHVAATIGIAAPLSHLIHAEPTVTSMIVLIGMAVGVDYSLFYLKREREERAKGRTHPRRRRDRRRRPPATRSWSPGAAVIASMAGLF